MLVLSHVLNLAILIPLIWAFALRPAQMDPAFGPDSDARSILFCLYGTIALVSVVCLVLLAANMQATALNISMTLFAMQIAYKLATVPVVGLQSPVVMTNLVVVAVHTATLIFLWRAAN
jgi:hypothetical protein